MSETTQSETHANAYSCDGDPHRQNTHDDTWMTVGLAFATLFVSLYFLANTWKHWMALYHSVALVASVPPSIAPNRSRRGGNTPASASTGENEDPSAELSRRTQRSLDAIHSTGSEAVSIGGEPSSDWPWSLTTKYWLTKLLHPRTVNQLVGNLLLCSWVILTLDQLFHALFIFSITFVCPRYNCVDYNSFATPACAAGPFEAVQLVIQPFGSCLFIVATINRFVNVYSKLSRGRFLALRVGTFIVCFVCGGLRIVTAMTCFVTLSNSWSPKQVAEVQQMLVLSDFITYPTLGITAVGAFLMGLQYIYEIRKEVTALRPSIATASIFNAADTPNGVFSFLAVAGTAQCDPPLRLPTLSILGSGSVLTETSLADGIPNSMAPKAPDPQRPSMDNMNQPSAAMGPSRALVPKAGKLPPTAAATLHEAYQSDRRRQVTTVACILVNIALIISFIFQHPYISRPTKGGKSSTLLDLTVMSLVQKVFAAVATVTIQLMSDLVLANKKSSMGPRCN